MDNSAALLLSVLLLCGRILFADEAIPDVSPIISQKGDLIFEDEFGEAVIKPEWVGKHGTQWAVVDGTLKGKPSTSEYQKKQIAKNNRAHSGMSPTSRLLVSTDDCILLFRFKMTDGLTEAHFGFDDGNSGTQHIGRLIVGTKTGMAIQKDKNAKLKGDKDETLTTDEFNVEPDKWYWMMLEVIGDEMVAQVSGSPMLRASHPRFDLPKGHINLPARGKGGAILYDHVRVWKAIPAKASE